MLYEQISVQVAAGATNENAFANSRYATLPRPARLTYFLNQDSADSAGVAKAEISHGNTIVRSLSPVALAVNAGEEPNQFNSVPVVGGADINDRIVIRLANEGATNAANFRIVVGIELF